MGFEHLTDIHTAWHTQRIKHDFHRRSIRQKGHIFFRHNARDHALVAVAPSHLVANRKLALARDVNFYLLNDTGIDIVAALHPVHRAFPFQLELGKLVFVRGNDLADLVPNGRGIDLDVIVNVRQLAQ